MTQRRDFCKALPASRLQLVVGVGNMFRPPAVGIQYTATPCGSNLTLNSMADQDSPDDEPDPSPEEAMAWYVLKVSSNREKSVKASLERRIKREGLDEFFGQIVIPTQKIVDAKGGKKRIVEQKRFPGYMMIEMALNDESWHLVRDTTGVADFTGAAGRPIAMEPHEVERMLGIQEGGAGEDEPTKVKIDLTVGEIIKIKDGPFESFEGSVESIDETHGKISILIEIFGRPTPTVLDYWQVEKL